MMMKTMDDKSKIVSDKADDGAHASGRVLTAAAARALAEAAARREQYIADEAKLPKERGGRKEGLEPVRYGDWEVKGLASDF